MYKIFEARHWIVFLLCCRYFTVTLFSLPHLQMSIGLPTGLYFTQGAADQALRYSRFIDLYFICIAIMVGQTRADCDLGALLITKYRRPSLRWDPHSVMVVGWWVASPTPICFVGKVRPSSCLDFVEWARRETFRSDFHLKSLQSMSSHISAMLDLQSCTFLCTLSTRYKYTGCLHPRRLLQQGTFSRSFVVQGEDNGLRRIWSVPWSFVTKHIT